MCGASAALTFPTLEFSMCKRPRPIAVHLSKKQTARQGLCPGGGVGLRPSGGYMTGTVPLVAASIDWDRA